MKQIKIYPSIWRKELFIAFMCVTGIFLHIISGKGGWNLVLFLLLLGLFFLFMAFRERLMNRPYLIITDEHIAINRYNRQDIIRFNEVKSFECEIMRIWRFSLQTGNIIVHLVRGNGFVNIIKADHLTIKSQKLCERLNGCLQDSQKHKIR